ncbi:alpha/beta fold hydrolase [Ornithinimicrobium panacihumi]|uniref:alpha/beta fold hydrolase n=1 Tax=Ornithinimicrobium panacihumi TaxID=2008449 RepID=UPI003F8A2806
MENPVVPPAQPLDQPPLDQPPFGQPPLDQRIHRTVAQDPPGLPAADLPGLDRRWSRVVVAPDAEGTPRSWHLLDNGPLLAERGEQVRATLLCVHGNPTWSYLWRRVLEQAPPGWRVVAVDQLGMGFSERLSSPRRLAQRVDDLGRLTEAVGIEGPVYTLAHDWGGPVSLGWALAHRDQLAGVVLTNTAVHQPVESAPPGVIRLVRAPGLLAQVCERTPAFVRGTTALSVPPLPKDVRSAFARPYLTAGRRAAVADFVRDIPFEDDHPSRGTLDAIAEGVRELADLPALMVWGPRDPVFGERYLDDLLRRLPHADVQRYPGASHLVLEDRPEGVEVIWSWLRQQAGPAEVAEVSQAARSTGAESSSEVAEEDASTSAITPVPIQVDLTSPGAVAVAELGGNERSITFAELDRRVADVARGLAARGIGPGDRVATLVPPGIELTTLVYAVWRLGAVVVVADAGLGTARLGAALRSAGPRLVVGIRPALALAAATRVPGERLLVTPEGTELDALAVVGRGLSGPVRPAGDPAAEPGSTAEPGPAAVPGSADGAVLFTSGATGPPKGVVYTRDQLGSQVALLRDTFGLGPGQRLVAAFAPFALYGPALGLSSVVPDMDVTAPHTLTAAGLAEAVSAIEASAVFAAPAALRNIIATADDLTPDQREALTGPTLVLSAGAPVPVELLRQVREILPSARTHTPYGMTEALPVATLDPTELAPGEAESQAGVCVGRPVAGVEVRIAPLDENGIPSPQIVSTAGTVGEIVVRGPHVKDRYDRLWARQQASAQPPGWHRTGDVGHLDEQGRLWVEGRSAHVLTTAHGPLTPYAVEDAARAVPGLADVVAVGVGPAGTQQLVVVVVPQGRLGGLAHLTGAGRDPLAGPETAGAVRAAVAGVTDVPVAAVLVRDWLPVDVRHASKVDRSELAGWAEEVLHGAGPVARLGRRLRPGAPRRRSR